jgi:hypothetical protein
MPREIVTVQLGQCGNQGEHLDTLTSAHSYPAAGKKWALYTGNVSVQNTGSAKKASSRSGRPKAATAKTYSSTRLMTSIIFHAPSSSISNLAYVLLIALHADVPTVQHCLSRSSIIFSAHHGQVCTTRRTFSCRKMEVGLGITGRRGMLLGRGCTRRLWR